MQSIPLFILLLFAFIFGSLSNFKKRKQCTYQSIMTRSRLTAVGLSTLVFLGITYNTGHFWTNYLLVLAASVYILSGLMAAGIHEKGILQFTGVTLLGKIEKWEDLDEIRVEKNGLTKLRFKSRYGKQTQCYPTKDYSEIRKFISSQIRGAN
ncbi:hypothetical protein [Tindallia californiensis]|uniref:DUF5673 domain-containing protein n=1 Tax=Tindallia californiensis TaxID=159292 RepID=A0A1H3P7H9_9FIRM|nr:hypothetical protein [Tindallia californiensis]SDY97062.1 hypothetical protein SAMN05192546_10652 [Tindallia californiensis]